MATGDRVYRTLLAATRFFKRGWGPIETYERFLKLRPHLSERGSWEAMLAEHHHPVQLTKMRSVPWGDVYSGTFTSPVATMLPGFLPPESQTARFEMLLPKSSTKTSPRRPITIHLAGTGDHAFWRRRYLTALPLLKEEGIGAVLMENPFYGSRKPPGQVRSQLQHVSDLFVMGLALIFECLVLLKWLEGEGLGPIGLTGLSMGGHNASLAAGVWPKPVAVVPCLSWSTASSVFTEGILSRAVCWDVLEEQLFTSKVGRDEKRRELFQTILHLDRESAHEERLYSPSYTAAQKQPLLGEDSVNRASFHTHSRQLDKPEKHHLSETRVNFLSRAWPIHRNRTNRSSRSHLYWETVEVMRCVLDVGTHLTQFPTPLAPQNAIFIAAKDDLYVPRKHITDVRSAWPGCEVRYVEGGHVTAHVLRQPEYRAALVESMARLCSYNYS